MILKEDTGELKQELVRLQVYFYMFIFFLLLSQ